jgi:hypothetical protein
VSKKSQVDWEYLAAAYRLKIVRSAEIKAAAEAAIVEGQYSEALDEIASSHEPILSDVGPLFETVLGERGQALPEPLAAARTVTICLLRRVARGELPPQDAMHVLFDGAYEALDPDGHPEFSPVRSHGLEDLRDAFHFHDELEYHVRWEPEARRGVSFEGRTGTAALRAHERHMRALAEEWLRQHPPL